MGIRRKRNLSARTGRRVNLTRKGRSPAKNTNTERKKEKTGPRKTIPWRKIGLSISLFSGVVLYAAIVAGVCISLLYGYRYITADQYFSLKSIEIQGNSRLTSREILEMSGLDTRVNTLALSIDTIENRIKRNSWVEKVSVKRVLPDRLEIGIKERTPMFLKVQQGVMQYADGYGEVIAPVAAENFTPLPALEVETGAEDILRGLPELVQSLKEAELPLDMKAISYIRLSASRGLELYVENSRLKILIGLEEWVSNLHRLSMTLHDLQRRGELQQVREIKAQGSNVWVETSLAPQRTGSAARR